MWCSKCQADVAAEMAPDDRRLLCASCGSQIQGIASLATGDKTRQARELLERWSKNRWSEESTAVAEEPEFLLSEALESPLPELASLRRDPPEPRSARETRENSETQPMISQGVSPTNRISSPPQPSGAVNSPRTHHRHDSSAPPPHFPGEPMWDDLPAQKKNSSSARLQSFWGQMLAYAGVLALTIGAAFVLLGYFGGPEWQTYTPTGWLITTTGQMLLFLGVVTLVSGGMEQTTEEVARRIDRLGQRIVRIEWAAQNHALKGPSLPAERFETDEARSKESKRPSEKPILEGIVDDARR